MKIQRVFLAALLALTFPFISHAQIPRTLSYQGVLTDNAGKSRPDGNYTFKFCLYGSNSGGSPIWCESKSLSVKNGLFSTVLGEQTPFGAAVKFDKQYWLGIQVGNEPELAPRMALTSVGYVYALATAANGPIKPGDLLTTSEVPGHAMKATDVARSHGAVIGKAMSSLEKREGLVLVLVNLQ